MKNVIKNMGGVIIGMIIGGMVYGLTINTNLSEAVLYLKSLIITDDGTPNGNEKVKIDGTNGNIVTQGSITANQNMTVNGNLNIRKGALTDGSVETNDIADNAITNTKIADNSVDNRVLNNSQAYTMGYLELLPQNASSEGGEILLKGAGNMTDAYIDNYNNTFRVHSNGITRFAVNLTNGETTINGVLNVKDLFVNGDQVVTKSVLNSITSNNNFTDTCDSTSVGKLKTGSTTYACESSYVTDETHCVTQRQDNIQWYDAGNYKCYNGYLRYFDTYYTLGTWVKEQWLGMKRIYYWRKL